MPRRRPLKPPPLTVAEVLTWADSHRARAGAWPNADSGAIPEAPLGTSWRQVDNALRYGHRSLPGGSSLAQLLAAHRGHRNIGALPRLTETKVLRWADAWKRRTGQWPLIESGPIPEAPGDTWRTVNVALREGLRGLLRRESLPQLLARRRGVRNLPGTPRLTVETIVRWIDGHQRATGQWPRVYDGPVAGQPGETWLAVNSALRQGKRGLPGGNSLAKLLLARFGIVNRYRGGRPRRSTRP